jgi:polar amino acid transport system permease protein
VTEALSTLAAWSGPLLRGALVTIQIAVGAYALGLVIGLVGASAKLSGRLVAVQAATLYTTVVRAVPELLLIILLYYAGSAALEALLARFAPSVDIEVSAFAAAIGVLGFVQGAYMTEVFRGAIQAIPRGQIEAANAFGMGRFLRFRRIILPAMLPNALPGLSNLWMILIKDTALISVVGFRELFFTAQQAASSERMYFLFYTAAGVLYLVITLGSSVVFSRIESRFRRGMRSSQS